MKIYTIVRICNEEHNVARFCSTYTWADKVLVADGSSEDNTISIAKTLPNVVVRNFTRRKATARIF